MDGFLKSLTKRLTWDDARRPAARPPARPGIAILKDGI